MTVQMPEKIPLDMPPGDADAMRDLARDIGSAARCLVSVDVRIAGAAAEAPGWLGDDAAAAAAQVIRVDSLVRAAHDAMTPAAARLAAHAELVLETRSRVRALRHEQDEQFADAWRRWGELPDLHLQVMAGGPAARVIVADVERGEASRRRRHTALLEELENDAATTARLLVDSCAAVGGGGRSGDGNRVVAYLAAELPGWGDRELIRRGRALAERLTDTGEVLGEGNRLAESAAPFAVSPAFANAFLVTLGTTGVTWLLRFLGNNQFGARSAMAQLLAAAFGAAAPSGRAGDPVAGVLRAEYVSADPADGDADTLAAGLATVLAAGSTLPSGGARIPTVTEWTRQILVREQVLAAPTGRRQVAGAPELSDPAALAIELVAAHADPAIAAGLLADSRVWDALLTRAWNDGGAVVSRVIGLAASQPGDAGAIAVRTGLEVIGAGLVEGDPADWTVARSTVAAISPALGAAVAAQFPVAAEALGTWTDVTPGGHQRAVLQGLGYLVLDPEGAEAVESALREWASVHSGEEGAAPNTPSLSAVGVPAAYLAVKDYGLRLAHALDADELRAMAEAKELLWDSTVAQLPKLVGPKTSAVVAVAGEALALWWDFDGTWDDQPDTGRVYDRTDAAAQALLQPRPAELSDSDAVAARARAAFGHMRRLLGEPEAPVSPEKDYWALVEATQKSPIERLSEVPGMPEWTGSRVLSLFW